MGNIEQISSGATVEYDQSKPALLFGSPGRKVNDAAEVLQGAGVRLVDRLTVREGLKRLSDQPSLGLAWLELDLDDLSPDLERMLDHLEERALCQGTVVVASAPAV